MEKPPLLELLKGYTKYEILQAATALDITSCHYCGARHFGDDDFFIGYHKRGEDQICSACSTLCEACNVTGGGDYGDRIYERNDYVHEECMRYFCVFCMDVDQHGCEKDLCECGKHYCWTKESWTKKIYPCGGYCTRCKGRFCVDCFSEEVAIAEASPTLIVWNNRVHPALCNYCREDDRELEKKNLTN
jgi:hypothetical protein